MFKMFLKDYNFCHYCHAKEEQLMVCEPCGLVKYCNEKCQYNDAYRHDELCLKIKKYLADWLFYQSLSQEYRDEHEHEGLKALTQLVTICHREMTSTCSRQAGERTLEFVYDLRVEHENLCKKYGISGFTGFYQIFDTYLNLGMYFEAETYMNHPMTFGFGDMEAMAEFCLALAHVNNARDIQQEKELALDKAFVKMKLALWEIVIKNPADQRPHPLKLPLFLRKLKCKYNSNLVLYFFAKLGKLREEGSKPGARQKWKKLIQTVNHSDLKREFLHQLQLELENVDWKGNWILDLNI